MRGIPSLLGHADQDAPEKIVARVTRAEMVGEDARITLKFGSDTQSQDTFTKVKEGLLTDVSIRATGTVKRAKVLGEFTDVVQDDLRVHSVDLVEMGGIASAKIIRVLESAPKIEYESESDNASDETMNHGLLQEHALQRISEFEGHERRYVEHRLFKGNGDFWNYVERSIEGIDKEVTETIAYMKEVKSTPMSEIFWTERKQISSSDLRLRPSDFQEELHNSVGDFLNDEKISTQEKSKLLSHLFGARKPRGNGHQKNGFKRFFQ